MKKLLTVLLLLLASAVCARTWSPTPEQWNPGWEFGLMLLYIFWWSLAILIAALPALCIGLFALAILNQQQIAKENKRSREYEDRNFKNYD